MRLLENQLGYPLFERTAQGVVPTEAASFLHQRLRELRKSADEALLSAGALAVNHRRLRVGSGRMQHSLLLDDVCYEFARRYPEVELEYSVYDAEESIDRVCDHDIDVVEYWHSPNMEGRKCLCTPVLSARVCVALARDHPLAAHALIDPVLLAGERVATNADGTFSVVDRIKATLRERCPGIEFVDADLDVPMEQHVMGGLLAIVPDCYQLQGAYATKVPLDIEERIEVSLLTASEPDPTVRQFIDLALEMRRSDNSNG